MLFFFSFGKHLWATALYSRLLVLFLVVSSDEILFLETLKCQLI